MLTRFHSAINFLFHYLLYIFLEKNKGISCILPLNINNLIQIAFNYLTNLWYIFIFFSHNKMGGKNMNYLQVPNDTISTKDLDYLSDIFSWNYNAYKEITNSKEQVVDSEILTFLTKVSNIFHENLTVILNILRQGGNHE